MTKVIELPEETPLDDGDFRRRVTADRRHKGAWAEAVVIADLLERGYIPSVPTLPAVYDLVVDRNGEFLRVQVKLGSTGRTMLASIGWTSYRYDYAKGAYRPTVQTKYDSTSFDYLAAVDRGTREVFYVPVEDIDFKKSSFSFNRENREKYSKF